MGLFPTQRDPVDPNDIAGRAFERASEQLRRHTEGDHVNVIAREAVATALKLCGVRATAQD